MLRGVHFGSFLAKMGAFLFKPCLFVVFVHLPGFSRFSSVFLGFPRFSSVFLGFPRFSSVLLGSPRFSSVLLGSPRFLLGSCSLLLGSDRFLVVGLALFGLFLNIFDVFSEFGLQNARNVPK